jgi:chemotaxis protein MotA
MIGDPFIKKGFQLAVDGTAVETIRNVLEDDIRSMRDRHSVGQGIFRAIAVYAPAFGMIGTLIGLIQMLRQLENPASIGKGMAVALITTLYGALIAYLFALPLAGKLEQRSQEELSLRLMAMEGILAIQQGSTLKVVQEKLTSYIPPRLRAEIL